MDPNAKNVLQRNGLVCLLLVIGTALLYWPVGAFEFIGYDDPFYIINNAQIKDGFTFSGITWAFGQITSGFTYWHPLTWMSHMLDFQLFGLNAGAQHRMNVLYHVIDAGLLFFLLQKLTGAFWRSAIVAALFAWHPLNVETVAWVTERKNILSTFFLLLIILFYQRYSEKCKALNPTAKVDYALALFFFACGLMSKPMLVTVPGVLLLLDFWPLRRISNSTSENLETHNSQLKTQNLVPLFLEKIPFLVLAIVSAIVTVISHKEFDSLATGQMSFGLRLTNAFYSYARYLKKMIWPNDLAGIYPFPSEWPVARLVICVAVFVAISTLAVWFVRRRPYILFGWLWFLGTLVPVIGIVQAGAQAMADRFAYVPLIGLFIAVVWGVADLANRYSLPKIIKFSLAALALAACCVGTTYQLPFWKDSIAFFQRALAIENENPIAHYNLGYAYAIQGKSADAKKHYLEAIRITRDYVDARNNLAALLLSEGKPDEAILQYREVLKAHPNHPLASFNLGIVLEKQGEMEEALQFYSAAAKNQPANVDFSLGLANALGKAGRSQDAMNIIMQTVQANPTSPEANYQAGNAMMMMQKLPEALVHYGQAVKLKPNYPEAHYNWGTALAMSGRVPEATSHFSEAVHFKPDFAEARLAFGMALSENGRKEEAAQQYREALRLAKAAGQNDLAAQIETRLNQP